GELRRAARGAVHVSALRRDSARRHARRGRLVARAESRRQGADSLRPPAVLRKLPNLLNSGRLGSVALGAPAGVVLAVVKRLTDLTIGDLTAPPVWRYEGGSGAEAIVSPSGRTSLSEEDDEVFLAATEFHLADSTRHLGFCFPADDSGIDYLQPVIVAPG